MNKEKLYKESETFPIYRNYGVLGGRKKERVHIRRQSPAGRLL